MTATLQTVLIVAAIAVVAGALASWITWMLTSYPPKLIHSAMLNAREQTTLAAAADAFFPPGGPIPVSGSDAGAVRYFDNYLSRCRSTQRLLTRLLFAFTEYSPLWFGPHRRRFSRLSQAQRITFLDRANTCSIYFRRVAFISLRALMTMAYLANRQVAQHMNMARNTDPFGIGAQQLEVVPSTRLPNAGAAA